MNISKKQIMFGNFLGGLSWGFGTVIGASLVVAILVYILSLLGIVEPFKPYINSQVLQNPLPETDK